MTFFTTYAETFARHVAELDSAAMQRCFERIRATAASGHKVFAVGNGGSASIASHFTLDLTKSAGIRALNFNEAGLLTCLANDHGYEEWVATALALHADPGDLVFLISSSGRSENMQRAAAYARAHDIQVVTLTGFGASNPLRGKGAENLWVDSSTYNIVEGVHHVWLLALVDALVEENS